MKVILILSISLSIFGTLKLKNIDAQRSEKISVEGFVYDNKKYPIIGANVVWKGTTVSTLTDLNGRFKLSVEPTAILVISSPGYVMVEIKAKQNIVAYLEEMAVLNEVAISRNLSSQKKKLKSHIRGVAVGSPLHANAFMPTIQEDHEYISYENSEEHNYNKPAEIGFKSPIKSPYSTFSLDVDKAGYSNIRRFINNGQSPPTDAVRIEEMINYFDYNYVEPKKSHPISLNGTLTDCPWNKDHNVLHISMKAKELNLETAPASHLVFLIDVSGSMSDTNKLPLVKSSLKLLVDNLREEDKISIVTYSGNTKVTLKASSAIEKEKIVSAIDNLHAGGSTAGGKGLEMAYNLAIKNFIKEGNNRIILTTDGDFNVGVNSAEGLETFIKKKRSTGVYLSVLGFGMGNYKDHMMQTLADAGNGNHAYIDNMQEAKKIFINEFSGTLYTVAKDTKIQVEFNPAYVGSYRLIGYENRMLNDEDFNNDKKDAGEIGAGHTVTAIYEIIPKGVESSFSTSIDPTKYQKNDTNKESVLNGEWVTIKCRYKNPDKDKSTKFSVSVKDKKSIQSLNNDIGFSLCVAEFGLILSKSQYIISNDLSVNIERAKKFKGEDKDGYRSEMIRLMELYGMSF